MAKEPRATAKPWHAFFRKMGQPQTPPVRNCIDDCKRKHFFFQEFVYHFSPSPLLPSALRQRRIYLPLRQLGETMLNNSKVVMFLPSGQHWVDHISKVEQNRAGDRHHE